MLKNASSVISTVNVQIRICVLKIKDILIFIIVGSFVNSVATGLHKMNALTILSSLAINATRLLMFAIPALKIILVFWNITFMMPKKLNAYMSKHFRNHGKELI